MKKIILIVCLCFLLPAFAQNCNVTCLAETLSLVEKETFLKKITGVSFASKKIAEIALQKELNDELKGSKFNADLEIFNLNRLKKGEFKALGLTTPVLKYRALSMSDFKTQTICPFNKIVYKNRKIYFPLEIPFNFEGKITNSDLQNVLNSAEFQKEIKKFNIVGTPDVTIKDGYLNFKIPVKALFSFDVKFKANVEVQNNNIVLRNITFNSKSNIINNDILAPIIENVNPIAYELNSVNGKYFTLDITKAVIVDDVIKTNGVFTINKNYSEGNE